MLDIAVFFSLEGVLNKRVCRFVSAPERHYSNEAALSLRSRRNGTKFAAPLPAELLIKYQRLPRGFFWNSYLPPLVCWLFCFLKKEFHLATKIDFYFHDKI